MNPTRALPRDGGDQQVDADVAGLDLVALAHRVGVGLVGLEERDGLVVAQDQVRVMGGERIQVLVDLEHVLARVPGHPPELGPLLGDPAVDEVEVLGGPDGHDRDEAEAFHGLLEHGGTVDHAVLLLQLSPIGDDGDEFAAPPQRELVAEMGPGNPGGSEGDDPEALVPVVEVPDPAGGGAAGEVLGEPGRARGGQHAVGVAGHARQRLRRIGVAPGHEPVHLAPGGRRLCRRLPRWRRAVRRRVPRP